MIDKKLLKLKSKDIKIVIPKKDLTENDLLEIPQWMKDLSIKDQVVELERLEKQTGFKRKKILEDQARMEKYKWQSAEWVEGHMGSMFYRNPENKEETARDKFPTPRDLYYLDPSVVAQQAKEKEELKERAKRDAEAWKHERQGARNLRLDKQVIDIIYQDMVPMKRRTKRMIIDYFRKNFMGDFKIIKDKYLSGHIGRAVDRLTKLQQIDIERVGKGKKPKKVYVLGRLAKVTNMSIVQAEQNKKARQQRDQRAIYMKARYEAKRKKSGK